MNPRVSSMGAVRFNAVFILTAFFCMTGCSRVRTVPHIANATVVDLTHPYDAGTIYWPTSPGQFEMKVLARGPTEGGYWYEANSFCTPEHGGTHLDAPLHFARGMWSVAEVPIDRLVGPAVVIDVRADAVTDPNYTLTRNDVARFEAVHGRIPDGAIVLLDTGYAERWPDRQRYLGDDTPGDASKLRFPSYGAEAVRWLIEKREVRVLGVDTASIDPGASRDFPVHRIAGAANVVGLENLTNVHRLPPVGAWVVALPMKISGGSGAPARVIALVPQ